MNARTLLAAHVVEEALDFFDVGRLLRYWPAAGGIENSNYFVSTTKGEFVLTLLEREPYAGDEFLNLLLRLDGAGLPVPAPLPDRGGRFDLVVQGKAALLQPRLPGTHVLTPTTNQMTALGRLIARIHRAAMPAAASMPQHPRDGQWLVRQATSLHGRIRPSTGNDIDTAVASVVTLLHRHDVLNLPAGVIHGDIFRDNVLFSGDALTGLIDFHHAARGTLLYDLAVAANDWCCDSTGTLNTEKTVALLRGYHSQRPLTREELWFFSPFRLYAALSFWLSRLTVFLQASRNQATRTKNPREMERITLGLLRGFEYFDERLFTDPDLTTAGTRGVTPAALPRQGNAPKATKPSLRWSWHCGGA